MLKEPWFWAVAIGGIAAIIGIVKAGGHRPIPMGREPDTKDETELSD